MATSDGWRPGPGGKLLVSRSWTSAPDAHGNEWVATPYLVARRECFKSLPRSTWPTDRRLKKAAVRRVLTDARASVDLGPLVDSGVRVDSAAWGKPVPAALLRAGGLYVWLDAAAWDAWWATGLAPRLSASGQVLWFGRVRSQRALLAVLMPIRFTRPPGTWLA